MAEVRRLSYRELKEFFPEAMKDVREDMVKRTIKTPPGLFTKIDAEREFYSGIRRQVNEQQNNPTTKKLRTLGVELEH